MRSLFLSLLLIPVLASAQINRSAREFASERIQEYITTKLFTGQRYKPVSLGDLKEFHDKRNVEIAWTIEHKFEMTDTRKATGQNTNIPKQYKFQFYLDDKMKVVKAESYFVE